MLKKKKKTFHLFQPPSEPESHTIFLKNGASKKGCVGYITLVNLLLRNTHKHVLIPTPWPCSLQGLTMMGLDIYNLIIAAERNILSLESPEISIFSSAYTRIQTE